MIIKTITTPNGPAQYHVLKKIESLAPFTTLALTVDSYFDETAFQNQGNFSRRLVQVQPPESIGNVGAFAENWLVSDSSSDFFGGVITVDNSNTLEAAKARVWARVKANRAEVEVGNFIYDGGAYQADSVRINGAVTLALMAKMANLPFSIGWTLTDNTVRILNAEQMIAMGKAVGEYVDGVFATARTLRTQIEAASTIDEVNAILWPKN